MDRASVLDRHRQRQLGHRVKEQGAAVGGLEQAGLVGVGAGEAALLVAEELAFHQLRRDRAAVDRHERRSEEHTSELQSLMRISYAVFCLKKKKKKKNERRQHQIK